VPVEGCGAVEFPALAPADGVVGGPIGAIDGLTFKVSGPGLGATTARAGAPHGLGLWRLPAQGCVAP
jgi:hypothetical protein